MRQSFECWEQTRGGWILTFSECIDLLVPGADDATLDWSFCSLALIKGPPWGERSMNVSKTDVDARVLWSRQTRSHPGTSLCLS